VNAQNVVKALTALGSAEKAAHLSRFFKTGPGQYGEGDQFIGVRVPEQRLIARKFSKLAPVEVAQLVTSPLHECRLTGLLILVNQFSKSKDENDRKEIVDFYLSHLDGVNNWDLVDLSAPKILGQHLLDRPTERDIIYRMAKSQTIWERRIAVLSTFPFIRAGDFKDILQLSKQLLDDKHDLMHKVVGWMLREMGKIKIEPLEKFLEKNAGRMPRTMLRYSIERFDPEKRSYFMSR
jgi:3-methyladenine DNA glycosylase AlkD